MNLFKRISLLSLVVFLAGSVFQFANAQSEDETAVQETIKMLFDGMRTSDSSMVAKAFTKNAIMKTVTKDSLGQTVVQSGNLQGFLNAVGSPKERVWDEKIKSYDINIDGDLATAWTPYEFWVGEDFSHCGVNSFQLVRMENTWEIVYIIDTRRREGCR